jgi:hypothetical protein
MIVTFFIYVVYLFVYGVTSPLRLFPDVSFPSSVTNAVTTAGGYLTSLNAVIPIATILTILGIVLVVEGYLFAYKVIMWLIKRLPTQS